MTARVKQPRVIMETSTTLVLPSAAGSGTRDVVSDEEEGVGGAGKSPQLPGILPIHYVAVCVL